MIDANKINKEQVEDIVGLSPIQKGMLFHYLSEPNSNLYVEQMHIKLNGVLHIPIFKQAWNAVASNNEMLRTVFRWEKINEPVQIVMKNYEIPVYVHDFSNANDVIIEAEIQQLAVMYRDMDIRTEPFRVACIIRDAVNIELLITFHHILYDGWSNGIVMKEFFDAYYQLLSGKEPVLERKRKYKDYVVLQQQSKTQIHHDYWKKELDGFIQKQLLPCESSGEENIAEGNHYVMTYDVLTSQAIERFIREQGISLAAFMYASWAILLHKYCQSNDIVFGTTVSGRSIELQGIERMIGLFINTPPLRVAINPEATSKQLLIDVSRNLMNRNPSENIPLAQIMKSSDSRLSGSLFDSIIVIENYPLDTSQFQMGQLNVQQLTNYGTTNYDLTLEIKTFEEMQVNMIFNPSVFRLQTIQKLSRHLSTIIRQIVSDSAKKILEIEMLSEEERYQLLASFNDTTHQVEYNDIVRKIEAQVERNPHDTALKDSDTELTYLELNEQANRIASYIRGRGYAENGLIAVFIERSASFVVSLLGILKAGAAYVPIDPDYPAERVEYLLNNSEFSLLLTNRKQQAKCAGHMHIEVEQILESTAYSTANFPESYPTDRLMYVLYTSGSTGKPKGVMVQMDSFANLLDWFASEFNISSGDKLLLIAPVSFDLAQKNIFAALVQGAALHLFPAGGLNYEQMSRIVEDQSITSINCAPSAFYPLLDFNTDTNYRRLRSLRNVFLGGEPINQAKLLPWIRSFRNQCKVVNTYGPTECTDIASFYTLKSTDYESLRAVPIGKPIFNVSIYILDEYHRLLPIGCTGEIYISGIGVSRGYFGAKQLTAEKFVPNPYMEGTSMYKTGDIGRWLPDGNIEYLGRKDQQVKIRGYRIELGEIENQLLLHPFVREAVVAAKNEPEGGAYLCAYMVASGKWTVSGLREHLLQALPDYMVPAYFTELDALPLSANGKVDRKALPDPERNQALVDYAAARTENEQLLVDIWQQVLGVERIGIHDRFFERGGDSIKAIQVSARLQKHERIIDMQDLFKYPTIGELSLYVRTTDRNPQADKEVKGQVALTPVQEWFFEQKLTDQQYWNQAYMLYRQEGFEEAKVREVLGQIVLHHDALRMVYRQRDNGEWTQYNRPVAEGQGFGWSMADMRGEEEPGPLIEREANALHASLNLREGPLLKAKLLRTDEGDHLLIVIHHLVIDGVSWRILFEDFAAGYEQAKAGEAIVFQRKTESFKVWSERLRAYGSSKALMQEKSYWEKEESKAVQVLPTDFEAEGGSIGDSGTMAIEIGGEETSQLIKQAGKAYNTDVNELLLTALGMSIQEWSGQEQVLVGLEAHGREQGAVGADVARTIGWFTSMYPLVLDMSETRDLSRLIRQTKEKIRSVPNKGMGYGVLRYVTEPAMKQELRFALTPEISFNYLGQFDEDIQTEVFKKSAYGTGQPVSAAGEKLGLLNVNAVIINKRLQLVLDYSKKQYKEQTMSNLTERLRSNLLMLLEHCMSRDKTQSTPSDFYLSTLSIGQLDELVEETSRSMVTEIDQLYPMNAIQQGILYHSLLNRADNPYFQQMIITIDGRLAIDHLQQAIDGLVARHEALRSVFIYKNIDSQPIQLVKKWSNVNVVFVDFSMFVGDDREQRFAQMKDADLENGFDLSRDTLMRLAVAKLADDSYRLIWSFHHIIMDGWCIGIILKEFFQIYEASIRNTPAKLQPVYAYKNYMEWSGRQDQEAAREYWTNYLGNLSARTDLSCFRKNRTSEVYINRGIEFTLDVPFTNELKRFATAQNVTLNCIFQTAWAILLAKYNDSSDVVFGTVVSGRPAEVKGIETMVGIFINTIPVRTSFDTSTTCLELLREMQSRSLASSHYDYLPLYEIQMLTELKQDLIDHIFVFENYPQDKQVKELGSHFLQGLSIKDVQIYEQTNYGFNIVVCPDEAIHIKLKFNDALYYSELIEQIGVHLEEVLIQMTENVQVPINRIVIGNSLEMSSESTAREKEQYDF